VHVLAMPALAGNRIFLKKLKLNNQPVAIVTVLVSQYKQGKARETVPESQHKQVMATASWHIPVVALQQLLLLSEQWCWFDKKCSKTIISQWESKQQPWHWQ